MNAVILYDDCALAARAHTILTMAAHRANEDLERSVMPWRLDMLIFSASAAAAFRDAVNAHLIVFAIRDRTDLSPPLLNWLEKWASCREVQEVALGMFDRRGTGARVPDTSRSELVRFAEHHGLSFIVGHSRGDENESAMPAHHMSKCKTHAPR